MKKRKKAKTEDPLWWEALHKAQDWDAQGVPHRVIARRLGKEGYSLGRGKRSTLWSDMAVTRALDQHPREPVVYPTQWQDETTHPLFDKDSAIEVKNVADDGDVKTREMGTAVHPGEFDSEAEYQAFKAETLARAREPRQDTWASEVDDFGHEKRGKRAYPALKPRDWQKPTDFMDAGRLSYEWENTWGVGEQGWNDGIVPYVAAHVAQVGWSALDRIDRLGGDPVDRAKLRMVYLGLMRRLCMREETVLYLRAELEKLKSA
jgi:hypothetical protein